MVDYLVKVKTLLSLGKLVVKLNSGGVNPSAVESLRKELSGEWGIDLKSAGSTTPKKLYGKTYRELSKEEIAEYSQIKRTLKRYQDEK